MLIQAGVVFGSDYNQYNHRLGAGGTLGVLWTPWKSGGIWSEAGVLDDPFDLQVLDPTEPVDYEQTDQHFEVSAGLIAVGSRASGGFLRAGAGAYRIETANWLRTSWRVGGSLGAGLRFGSQAMRALPTVEARLHLTTNRYDEVKELFVVTGGIWFR